MNSTSRFNRVFLFLLKLSVLTALLSLAALILYPVFTDNKDDDSDIPAIASPFPTTTNEQIPTPLTVDKEPDTLETTMAEILANTDVPENDPYQIAKKYKNLESSDSSVLAAPVVYRVGQTRNFWVLNTTDNDYRKIQASLIYETPHVYFWAEKSAVYDSGDVKKLVDTFEKQIYPWNRQIFGTERSPGLDNDVHLTILYARDLGGAAGYFSSADVFPPEIEPYSNNAEMFYLSADYLRLNNDYVLGVLAHEFQHMIHWNMDRNEASWINEGLSEFAVEANRFQNGGFASLFAFEPDLQLNYWPGDSQGSSTPHYGASHLFIKYLHDRFGLDFISALVSQPKNGFSGVDAELKRVEASKSLFFDTVFQDFTLANFLQDTSVGDGQYGYESYDTVPAFFPTETITCGSESIQRTVSQFGTDYIKVDCDREYTIEISWNETIPVVPVNSHSGKYSFWSNRGHESTMKLSREFDLSAAEGDIFLEYWAWFDIEKDYDYLYVNVSEDGERWETLAPPSCTQENPTGANLGCGYNGKSDGWTKESLDLSDYGGKKIILEFEYITDASVNGEGFLLDDVTLDAIGLDEDFEESTGEWTPVGFVRLENELPQFSAISLIRQGNGIGVEKYLLKANHSKEIIVPAASYESEEILVISGLTEFTHLPMEYTVSIN